MGTFNSLEEARDYMRGDTFAMSCGMHLDELTDEYSVCSMEVTGEHLNVHGTAMGGVIFTLADIAFGCLAGQLHRPTMAMQASVSFLSAARGKRLIARASCRKSGRSTTVANVDVTDENGRDVAQVVITGFKL